jgi:hypothetical protein
MLHFIGLFLVALILVVVLGGLMLWFFFLKGLAPKSHLEPKLLLLNQKSFRAKSSKTAF